MISGILYKQSQVLNQNGKIVGYTLNVYLFPQPTLYFQLKDADCQFF